MPSPCSSTTCSGPTTPRWSSSRPSPGRWTTSRWRSWRRTGATTSRGRTRSGGCERSSAGPGACGRSCSKPFDAEATAELLAVALGTTASPSLSAAVFDRTDGVPFFVEELGIALTAGGRLRPGPRGLELLEGQDLPLPDSVRDAVLLQAADLTQDARTAAMAAAVAGQEFSPSMVTAVAGLQEWPDELLRRGLVVEAGSDRMAFRHALIRDAFYGELPWTQRVEMHRPVAERLDARCRAGRRRRGALGEGPGAGAGATAPSSPPPRVPSRPRVPGRSRGRAPGPRALAGGGRGGRTPRHPRTSGRVRGAGRRSGRGDRRLARGGRGAATERRPRPAGRGAPPARVGARAAGTVGGGARVAGAGRRGLRRRGLTGGRRRRASVRGRPPPLRRQVPRRARPAGACSPDARQAGRIDLEARILGLEGNVRARMGEGSDAVELVRTALATALDAGLTGPAAGDLPAAGRLAGACRRLPCRQGHVRRRVRVLRGEHAVADRAAVPRVPHGGAPAARRLGPGSDRSAAGSSPPPDSTAHARAVATGTLGSILGVRGQTRRARPLAPGVGLAGSQDRAARRWSSSPSGGSP